MKDHRSGRIFIVGLLVAIAVAVGVSQFASTSPDGLEFVAEQEGFAGTVEDHDLADGPLAEYGQGLTDNDTVNTAVAGVAGVLVTLGLGYGVFWLARRRDRSESTTAGS